MEKLQLDRMSLADVLDAQAASQGHLTLLKHREGSLTVAQVKALADRLASGLDAHGVKAGDHVAVMLPNCVDFAVLTFALARLGAVMVPVNTAYHGILLQRLLGASGSTTAVIDEPLLARLEGLDLPGLDSVVVRMQGTGPVGGFSKPAVPLARLMASRGDPPKPAVGPHRLQSIIFTSGTTGPSKGAMVPHRLALTCAVDSLRFLDGAGKTIYCPLPLFHAAGMWDGLMAALAGGGSLAIVETFSASRFWDDVRRFDAAVAMGVFSMIPILLNRPPRPDDRDNPLETFYMGKSALDRAFFERFGTHTVETYTSTEIGIGTASPYGEWRTGSCGRAHHERFEVEVFDETDETVPAGRDGELVVRPKQPWIMFRGYHGAPEATAHCFRNLWYHTGDCVRRDTDGYFTFVSRIKDAIRRRGENISAFELECVINTHPKVLESAAFGVRSEIEDEEVAVAVVVRPDMDLAPEELAVFCENKVPAFMVPRFVEFVDDLPRSATGKIAKHVLKGQGDHGITPTMWDRDRWAASGTPNPEATA
jgi:crotonobetaine/carnitine-CoA ligase